MSRYVVGQRCAARVGVIVAIDPSQVAATKNNEVGLFRLSELAKDLALRNDHICRRTESPSVLSHMNCRRWGLRPPPTTSHN